MITEANLAIPQISEYYKSYACKGFTYNILPITAIFYIIIVIVKPYHLYFTNKEAEADKFVNSETKARSVKLLVLIFSYLPHNDATYLLTQLLVKLLPGIG